MFLYPLGLLALVGVPLVALAHIFRRRFRPHTVSAVFLWREDDSVPLAGRRREKLRSSPSLWAELLAALCMGLAFAGPKGCTSGAAEHLVVVLDGSASMEAGEGSEGTRARLLEELDARIDALSARSRVTLLVSGERPRFLAGPAAFPVEARERAQSYRPTRGQHSLTPAVALGLQLAGDGKVLLLTDEFDPDAHPGEVEVVSVGKPHPNVALSHATRIGGSEGDRVLLTVSSFANTDKRVRLQLTSLDAPPGTAPLVDEPVELSPDSRKHLAFRLAPGTGVIEARLTPDALAIDDRLLLAPVPPRTLAIGTGLEEEDARLFGLASGQGSSNLDRLLAAVPGATEAVDASSAHLWIDRSPAGTGTTWNLVFPELGESTRDLIGPFLAEKRHPLLAGLTLDGIVWSLDPDRLLPGAPLISAGDHVALSEVQDPARRVYHLNLAPRRSSLALSPDWPIFLTNLAEARRRALPGAERTNLGTGESFVWRARRPANYAVYFLGSSGELARNPDSEPQTVREVSGLETLILDGLDEPGLYALESEGRELVRFAVHFADPRESDLRSALPGRRASERTNAALTAALGTEQLLLFAAALAAIVFDWWVLARGNRVRRPARRSVA